MRAMRSRYGEEVRAGFTEGFQTAATELVEKPEMR
jgi:hypothetical protein